MDYKKIAPLALCYGILSILFALSRMFIQTTSVSLLTISFSVISVAIYSLLFINFKKLLNSVYKSNALDNLINLCIVTSIVSVFYEFMLFYMGIDLTEISILDHFEFVLVSFALLVFMGVLSIVYSNKLRKISNDGNFKMYANFELANGIAILSIIGANSISGILSGIGFIYLFLIFKNSGDNSPVNTYTEVKRTTPANSNTEVRMSEPVTVQTNNYNTVEEYLNSLDQEGKARIENKALAYLPKGMSQEEKDLLIRQYVEREIL